MADLLIRNHEHWMDRLTEVEVAARAKADSKFQGKYNCRKQKGDIVEVGEDNFWGDNQTGGGKFKILRIPGVKKADVLHYVDPLIKLIGVSVEGYPQYETIRRRQYRVNLDNLETRLSAVIGVVQPTDTDVHEIKEIADLSTDFIIKTEASELIARGR